MSAELAEATLLVIDDDPDIREILQLLLETDGYRVVTAFDGQDAVEKIRAGLRPDFILLDLMMPRMDGCEFLSVLHSALALNPPVVIMSGHVASVASPEAPVSAHLIKPINLADLMALVHRLVPLAGRPAEDDGRASWEMAATSSPPP